MKTILYAKVLPNGRVTNIGSTSSLPDISHIPVAIEGAVVHEISSQPNPNDVYWNGATLQPKGAQPSPHHTFNYTTKQWEDPRTLADLKAAKWGEIKQARSQSEYVGFTWDGSTFDSDATSQNRITGAVTLAQMSTAFSIDWVLADNSVRTLNQVDMLQVGAALGNHVAEQFSKGIAYRTAVEEATTAEEIQAVVWE